MAEKLEQYIKEEQDGAIDLVLGESMGGATAGMLFHRQKVKAIPHNSKCRYGERGAVDAGAVLKPQGGNCAVLP